MVDLSLLEIQEALNGTLYGNSSLSGFSGVSIDTRKIEEGNIYVALKGETFNGNMYVKEAFKSKATLCIVEEIHIDIKNIPKECSLLLVKDVHNSLGILARYYLDKLKTKVIGVTGSVGKTSTKDMICATLGSKYKVLKTLGNFNNHIGLPLTILRLDRSYDFAVLEMGMSNAGEIKYLAEIANPDIMVITNIGMSHIENLGSRENILKAKMESTLYFTKENTLIINGEDDMLRTIDNKDYKVVRVGENKDFDLSAHDLELSTLKSSFKLNDLDLGGKYSCEIDFPGKHNVINFLLSYAVCKLFNISKTEAIKGLSFIEKTSMRLDILDMNGYTVINDCYNASPDSMKSALDVQVNLNKKRNIAVLGSMFELGDFSNKLHSEVGDYIKNKNIDMVFATGPYTEQYKRVLGDICRTYTSKDTLIKDLKSYIRSGDSILIKASRGAKFEDIVNALK